MDVCAQHFTYHLRPCRPKFIALYSDDPDETGHTYGPESSDVTLMLSEVDVGLSLLTTGLKKRKILDCVNIIVVSDHGMAQHYNNMSMDIQQVRHIALEASGGVVAVEGWAAVAVEAGAAIGRPTTAEGRDWRRRSGKHVGVVAGG